MAKSSALLGKNLQDIPGTSPSGHVFILTHVLSSATKVVNIKTTFGETQEAPIKNRYFVQEAASKLKIQWDPKEDGAEACYEELAYEELAGNNLNFA